MQRAVGVTVPQGQNQVADAQKTKDTPRQLLSISELKTYAIQYTDDTGTVHVGLCHKLGEAIYIHPHDEQWAGSVRQAAGWLAKSVSEKIALHEQLQVADSQPEKPPVDLRGPQEG